MDEDTSTMIQLPEGYKEREPKNSINMVSRLTKRFSDLKLVMPEEQKTIYENLRTFLVEDVKRFRGYPKTIHKPTVVDVGCGLGIGTNILSHEAQFAWGIDINPDSVSFAQQMFAREPNNIYYTPQVTFDEIDILTDQREFMQFNYITCIEVIEHLPRERAEDLLKALNRFVKKDKKGNYITDSNRSQIFLSTPNRNAPNIQDDTPRNEHHCYEATAGEMYEFLTKHYQAVTVYDVNLQPQELDTQATPLVFKLENPLHAEG